MSTSGVVCALDFGIHSQALFFVLRFTCFPFLSFYVTPVLWLCSLGPFRFRLFVSGLASDLVVSPNRIAWATPRQLVTLPRFLVSRAVSRLLVIPSLFAYKVVGIFPMFFWRSN